MTTANPASEFVRRINAHSVRGLIRLMTPDHAFIDSLGEKFTRPVIEEGWRQYFAMVPDYQVSVDRAFEEGDTVILIGSASGTYVREGEKANPDNWWKTPAVWVAQTRGRKVAKWRIYSDNEPIRQKMGRSNQ